MVNGALAILALMAAAGPSASEPVGVLRATRGPVTVDGLPAPSGTLLARGQTLALGTGWGELLLGAHLRVRLSAGARVEVKGRHRVRLVRGRAWVELGARTSTSARFVMRERAVVIAPGTVAVLDASSSAVATVVGSCVLDGRIIRAGSSWSDARPERVEPGDGGLYLLVRREARARLGDLAGWRALVLAGARGAGPPDRWLDPEDPGARLGEPASVDLLLEESVRPPAFSDGATSRPAEGGP